MLNNISSLDEKKADSKQLKLLQETAFDEMNLVEIPFCLLQNTSKKIRTIPISPGGKEYLVTEPNSKFGFPTSLAEPTLLGLMWYCQDNNKFHDCSFEVSIRSLVENYMYPGKYKNFPASGQLMKAVETELWRIAFTKLYSKRWWDKENREHREVSFNLIDMSAPIERKNGKARVVRISWGKELLKSVRSRYTKNIDAKLYLQIEVPLDRRFFRWLDRHLSINESIEVKSIQRFARYKMLMQGKVIERGKRTASSYIFGKLKGSLERLNGLGFQVKMTADKTKPDFSLIFEKTAGEINEIVEHSPAIDLIHEFQLHFHGLKKERAKRLRERDIEFAEKWIHAFGYEQAMWMVKKCKDIHAQGPNSGQKVFYFKGLETYEVAASAAFEKDIFEKAGQQRLRFQQKREEQWEIYEKRMLIEVEKKMTPERKTSFKAQSHELAVAANSSDNEMFVTPLANMELKSIKLKFINALSKEKFESYETTTHLENALIERHGYNPLILNS